MMTNATGPLPSSNRFSSDCIPVIDGGRTFKRDHDCPSSTDEHGASASRLIESGNTTTSPMPDGQAAEDIAVMRPALDRLEKAASLSDSWAGDGSLAPSKQAITDARLFLDGLPSGVTAPRVNLAEDGEIFLEWRTAEHYAVIGIVGDGTASFAIRNRQGYQPGGSFRVGAMMPINLVRTMVVAS